MLRLTSLKYLLLVVGRYWSAAEDLAGLDYFRGDVISGPE